MNACLVPHSFPQCSVHSPAVPLPDHQWPPAVPLAGVLAAVPVAGAHHLGVELDRDPRPLVPHLALAVLYQRDVHHLQQGYNTMTYFNKDSRFAFSYTLEPPEQSVWNIYYQLRSIHYHPLGL